MSGCPRHELVALRGGPSAQLCPGTGSEASPRGQGVQRPSTAPIPWAGGGAHAGGVGAG